MNHFPENYRANPGPTAAEPELVLQAARDGLAE